MTERLTSSPIPADPAMAVSFVNMKLRDEYESLEELCDSLDVDIDALVKRLGDAGFEYSRENRRFF